MQLIYSWDTTRNTNLTLVGRPDLPSDILVVTRCLILGLTSKPQPTPKSPTCFVHPLGSVRILFFTQVPLYSVSNENP